jgi:hypothetical protein
VIVSSNGAYRVTIVPKSWGAKASTPQELEPALAHVERNVDGKWRPVWKKHLL